MSFLRWLAIIIISIYVPANASIISGLHTTDQGKTVNLQGLEWLSIDSTYGHSRTDIENGRFGLISDGWRYATRKETSLLLMSLWGETSSGGTADNADGADWFFRNLGRGPLQFNMSVIRNFFYGSTGECSSDLGESCKGFYGVGYSNAGLPSTGWFYAEYGLDANNLNPGTINSSLWDSRYGSLLVRGGTVPEPSTTLLLVFGCIFFAQNKVAKR